MDFAKLRRERPQYSSLIQDGIFDGEVFAQQSKRVLFVLKEGNHGCDRDFRQYLLQQNGGIWRTWNNVARWAQALLSQGEYMEYIPQSTRNEWLKKIAFLNLKKEGGGATAKSIKTIIQFAERDAEFIKGQIDEINPDIIICCGQVQGVSIAEVLQKYVLNDQTAQYFKIDKLNRTYYRYPNPKHTPVVSFVHPQIRGGHAVWQPLFEEMQQIKTYFNI